MFSVTKRHMRHTMLVCFRDQAAKAGLVLACRGARALGGHASFGAEMAVLRLWQAANHVAGLAMCPRGWSFVDSDQARLIVWRYWMLQLNLSKMMFDLLI